MLMLCSCDTHGSTGCMVHNPIPIEALSTFFDGGGWLLSEANGSEAEHAGAHSVSTDEPGKPLDHPVDAA